MSFDAIALTLALALILGAGAAAAEPKRIDALDGFGAVEDLDIVFVDVSWPIRAEEEARFEGCAFGELLDVARLAAPSEDHHLLVEIRPGDPSRHAANLAYCAYAPADGGSMTRIAVRGCYLAHALSIPTARQLLLAPLPARACGVGE